MFPIDFAQTTSTHRWNTYTPPMHQNVGHPGDQKIGPSVISKYIDWTPFFQSWQLANQIPAILTDPVNSGKEATKL